jgi:hypothetical protein
LGHGVYPDRYILAIPTASAVRKIEPTLIALRMSGRIRIEDDLFIIKIVYTIDCVLKIP